MTMLDGARSVFLEALSFADERTRAALVEKWSLECQAVYEYKKQLIAEEHYKSAHNKTEWISVEERLPYAGEDVLVFCDGLIRIDFIGSSGVWYEHNPKHVTHWMPLPEAPKMKGGEGGERHDH